jgi:hypothetical protein
MARGSTAVRALTGALVVMTAAASGWAAVWVKDPQSGCATTNPFPNPNESIRWFGNCRDGKLDGRGTLVWFRDGAETERNEGNFKDGELDGYAVTKYPEGYVVHGQYRQGQRHGQFMTIRGNDYIRATYFNGGLVSQSRLSPEEAADWNRRGGPQLIVNAPPPTEAAKAAAPSQPASTTRPPAAAEPPITGRTAVASPSRQLPPPTKPAAAPSPPPKPAALAAALAPQPGPASPSGNFVLGTQVIEAISAPAGSAAGAPAAAGTTALGAATTAAAPMPTLPAGPTLTGTTLTGTTLTGTTAAGTTAAGTTPATASPPPAPATTAAPARDPGGFYLAGPSLTSPPLPGSSSGKVKPAPQPESSRYQLTAPASPAPALPATAPTAGSIASPSLPGLPNVATAQIAATPQQVAGAQAPIATGSRRPPWMAPGSGDPVLVSGAPLPGQTPPPLPPTPMAGAAPLAGPVQPYVPPAYMPPVDTSPTAASRQYLALREAAETAYQMNALPSYRALQSAAPAPQPGVSPPAIPGIGMHASGSAEALFQQAYKLEMSGRFREAEQTYEQIILSQSNSQTAMLANERLNGIRRNTRDFGVRIADQRPAAPERQSAVVAVNEPRNLPRYAQATGAQPMQFGDSGAGDAGGGMTANLTGLSVCTQRGLYDKDSRWCGMVLADDGARLSVEVRDVLLPGFGNIGIGSSKCTGGTFINWFSKGSMVRVPRSCMELKG